jgi:2-polyprenyl-3-methyl-5-hydroxy-6-metoxy-1,4-benzoquinol methylase
MPKDIPNDQSNGYDKLAETYIRTRSPEIGAATVRQWSKLLPPASAVLDLGCGHGMPISHILNQEGFTLYGIDASPAMIAIFRKRFPHASAECSSVEQSHLFQRTYDGIVAWGLLFLLTAPNQAIVIQKVAKALSPRGRFLFTAPRESVEWRDTLTGLHSLSLGLERYNQLLADQGLVLIDEHWDEGSNHYYSVLKPEE